MTPCHVVDLDGGHAILKTAARRRTLCQFCKRRYVSKLCDFKIRSGDIGHTQTCDAGMCDQCAVSVARDVDYCPNHKAAAGE